MYKKPASGVLSRILGHIAFYCDANGLPQLNAIVVGKVRGTPGEEIPTDPAEIDKVREKVYKTDWYNIYPPTDLEFQGAREPCR